VRTAYDPASSARPSPRTAPAVDDLDALLAGRFDDLALLRVAGPRAAALPSWMLTQSLFRPAATFLSRTGKQLRGELVELGWSAGGGSGSCPRVLRETVELIHAGALIVDDIQDGATSRRGSRALHRRIGVPLALNVGNWLYFWPLERLARLNVPPETALALQRRIVHAVSRCHVGQALDLHLHPNALSREEMPAAVRAISDLKTGALTELAVVLGAVAAGASRRRTTALARFGHRVGVGVQMLNDLSDVGGLPGRRARFHDVRSGRVTWPWAWLAQTTSETTYRELRRRSQAVRHNRVAAAPLGRLLREHVAEHGRRAAKEWLARAASSLTIEVGRHRGVEMALERLRAYEA
jgi:geranylgeranyl pyrophosphate synthase